VIGPVDDQTVIREALTEAVGRAGGSFSSREVLESYRILRGLPAPGHELTEDYNPLEAGLLDAISFSKGCYVGQEVVARLRTYDKVSRSLVGLELPAGMPLPRLGAALMLDGGPVGVLTSAVLPPGSRAAVALGYVKRKVLRPDLLLQVDADGPSAKVVRLPFPRPTSG
jgi:folate-binding protein YgfZ